jgi:hypothetical protein
MELRALRTWYTQGEGWVTLDDDVLSIVRQVKELYEGRVSIQMEPTTGHYVFVEHCGDGTDRLIFTTDELDGRSLIRLMQADSQSRAYQDPYDAAERAQDDAQNAIDDSYRGYVREAGEHLAHAMKREGVEPRLPLTVSMHRKEKRARQQR